MNRPNYLPSPAGPGSAAESGSAGPGPAITGLLAAHEAAVIAAGEIPRFLIIGAGELAGEVVRHLATDRSRQLTVINRTRRNAERLVQSFGGDVVEWAGLRTALEQHHFIIAATSCLAPILTRSLLATTVPDRRRIRAIIDLGVPGNAEPDLLVPVFNLDHIGDWEEGSREERPSAIRTVPCLNEAAENGRNVSPVYDLSQHRTSSPVSTPDNAVPPFAPSQAA